MSTSHSTCGDRFSFVSLSGRCQRLEISKADRLAAREIICPPATLEICLGGLLIADTMLGQASLMLTDSLRHTLAVFLPEAANPSSSLEVFSSVADGHPQKNGIHHSAMNLHTHSALRPHL